MSEAIKRRNIAAADVPYLCPGTGMYVVPGTGRPRCGSVGYVPGPLPLRPDGGIVGAAEGEDGVPGGSAGMNGSGAENTRPPETSGPCSRSSPVSKSAFGGRAR